MCELDLKRGFDLGSAALGLLILLPVFIVVSAFIKIDSRGPIFFRQVRVGRNGRNFLIFKFRTMYVDAENRGSQITVGADPRITNLGRILRKYKLDELPQLLNVVRGDMSLVGPRPEVPRYVALYPEDAKAVVLSVRPGITDLASIKFRNENTILAASSDPQATYVNEIMPAKILLYMQYVQERTFWNDIRIVLVTVKCIFGAG